MIKKGFNIRLFWDGICQLKWIGFTGFVIYNMVSIFEVSRLSTSSISGVVLMLITAMMTLSLFQFLNTRDGSDFYYAVPNQTAVYVSYSAAILAWSVLIPLISVPISKWVYLLQLEPWRSLRISDIVFWEMGVCHMAAGVLTAGIVLVAMGLTDNVFGNIIASLVIACVPRLLLYGLLNGCFEFLFVLEPSGWVKALMQSEHQLVYAMLRKLGMAQSYYGMPETEYWAIGYSLILAMIYVILGGILFQRRKSETAGTGGIRKWVQQGIRGAVLLVFTVYGSLSMTSYVFCTNKDADDLQMALVLYVIGLFLYFVTEYLMERKFRVIRDCAWIGAVLVANAGLVVTLNLIANDMVNNPINADEIDGIRIVTREIELAEANESNLYELQQAEFISGLELTDERACEIVALRLRNQMHYMELGTGAEAAGYDEMTEEIVEIHHEGKKTRYRIWMPRQYGIELNRAIAESANQQESCPIDLEELLVNTYERNGITACSTTGWELNSSEVKRLQNMLVREIQELPYSYYLGMDYNVDTSVMETLVYEFDDAVVKLPISVNTPRTLETLAELVNEDNYPELMERYFDYEKAMVDYDVNLFCMVYDQNEKKGRETDRREIESWGSIVYKMAEDEFQALTEIFSKEQTEISADEHLLYVSFREYVYVGSSDDAVYLGEGNVGRWYNLTDQELAVVKQILSLDNSGEKLLEMLVVEE